MSTRRLVVTASQLREELDKLPRYSVIGVQGPGSSTEPVLARLQCAAVDLPDPSVLVLSPYDMAAADRALFDAIESKDVSAVLAAIAAGADVGARDGRSPVLDCVTPLMLAANSPEVVRILLERGADPNSRSGPNWTALLHACNAGCLESARLLLEAGADVHVHNDEGYSAYGRIPGNEPELLALLEAAGAHDHATTVAHEAMREHEVCIKAFADIASRVRAILESPVEPPSNGVAEIRLALAELHVAALRLPDVEPSDGADEPPSDESKICAERLAALPVDFYWDFFDPFTHEPGEPVGNSADDDLRDIYHDLVRGLALFEAGALRDACWSWRFGFTTHWGEHLVGVQRALYLASRQQR